MMLQSSRTGSLLAEPGKQQVAIAGQAEDVQVKGPEPGSQAADVLRQVAPGVPLHRLFRRPAEQAVDGNALSGMLE